MELFLSAFALLLIFEGLPYFINPNGMKNMAKLLSGADPTTLRIAGFTIMVAGLLILYLYRYSH